MTPAERREAARLRSERCRRNPSMAVTCYFNVNFRLPRNLFSILKPTALQIMAHR